MTCLFWSFSTSAWSSDGCQISVSTDLKIANCSCTHLTNFALGSPPTSGGRNDYLLLIILVSVLVPLAITAIIMIVIIIKDRSKKVRIFLEIYQESFCIFYEISTRF